MREAAACLTPLRLSESQNCAKAGLNGDPGWNRKVSTGTIYLLRLRTLIKQSRYVITTTITITTSTTTAAANRRMAPGL